jgi:hypothetical protein
LQLRTLREHLKSYDWYRATGWDTYSRKTKIEAWNRDEMIYAQGFFDVGSFLVNKENENYPSLGDYLKSPASER